MWDPFGNLTDMSDFGDLGAQDDVFFHIDYDACLSGANGSCSGDHPTPIFKPSEVTAKDAFGNVLRDRKATYDPTTAAMTSYTQVIIGGVDPVFGVPNTPSSPDLATWQFAYDARGNVSQVTDPRSYQVSYTYDPVAATYRTQAQDSFGYVSSSVPNYQFGSVASETDVNGNMAIFNYDQFGRLQTVDGPYDIGATEHTIAFAYSEGSASAAFPAYATTAHKDVQHPGQPIVTATFADGLGRIIETKKSLARDLGSGVTAGMAVSGAVVFDDQGRLSEQGQPFFDANPPTTFVPNTPTNPTNYGYDVLDRLISTALADAVNPSLTAIATITYGFDTLGGSTYQSKRFGIPMSTVRARSAAARSPGFRARSGPPARTRPISSTRRSRTTTTRSGGCCGSTTPERRQRPSATATIRAAISTP